MKKLLLSLVLFFSVTFSFAQWTPMGEMEGGNVKSIVVAGTDYFLLTDLGFFKSADNGVTWEDVFVEEKLLIADIAQIFAFGKNVFLGTKRGLYLCSDGGQTWTMFNTGLPRNSVVLTMATMGGKLLAATSESVFISDVTKPNWEKRRGDLPNNIYIRAMEAKGNNIYVATFGRGIFYSSNMGDNWTEINEGLTASKNQKILSMVFAGSTIIAGTSRNGVWVSYNYGQSWSEGNNGLSKKANVNSLIIAGGVVYAGTSEGVFVSRSAGSSWTSAGNGFPEEMPANVLAIAGSTVLAGTEGAGILKSTSGGGWQYLNKGLKLNVPVRSLIKIKNKFYAGTDGSGLYSSDDNGGTWTPANSGLPPKLSVRSIITKDTIMMIATDNFIYYSKDDGKTWVPCRAGLKNKGVNCLVVLDSVIYAGTEEGFYVSYDNGKKWVDKSKMMLNNAVLCIYPYITEKKDTSLYVGTRGGMYLSKDKAENWKVLNAKSMLGAGVVTIAISGNKIFAGTDKFGIIYSDLEADKWYSTNTGLDYQALPRVIMPAGKKLVYVVTDKGAYMSKNKGNDWMNLSMGLGNTNVHSMFMDDVNIYCGNQTGNVYFYRRF